MFLYRAGFAVVCFFVLKNIFSSVDSHEIECPEIDTIDEIIKTITFDQKRHSSDPELNIVLSPLGIGVLLNLLFLGTSGTTKYLIKYAFGYPDDLENNSINEKYIKVLKSIKSEEKDFKVWFNTRFFLHKEFSILEDSFQIIAETSYFTEVENLDFENFPDAAKDRINSWVSESTEEKIEGLIFHSLNPATKLVAVNTAFLNATWKYPFDPALTKYGIFFTGIENITIPMMKTQMNVPHFNDKKLGIEIISLPFKGDRLNMLILKPRTKQGGEYLIKLAYLLQAVNLKSLINKMENKALEVTIPKMKLDSEINLEEHLGSTGFNILFGTQVEFGGLSPEKGIIANNLIHKALFEITELGTFRASAPVGFVSEILPQDSFVLNSPSLLIIRDMEHDINLFNVIVCKPH